jgi:hypothetical protein
MLGYAIFPVYCDIPEVQKFSVSRISQDPSLAFTLSYGLRGKARLRSYLVVHELESHDEPGTLGSDLFVVQRYNELVEVL